MIRQLRYIGYSLLVLIAASACTDKRTPERKMPVQIGNLPPQTLQAVSDIRINGQDISAFQMTQKAGALYLTGTPFFFTKWDISSDAESPHQTFVAKDDVDTFQPMGRWRPDWYASGGLAILGPYAIMSGIVGTSFVNLSQTATPVEQRRYPPLQPVTSDTYESTPKDDHYTYSAIVADPTEPYVYGMREQDYMVVSQVSAAGLTNPKIVNYSQSGGSVCCVMGATVFNHKLFVAMRGMIRVYDMLGGGNLSAPMDIPTLQAVNISSSDNKLYIQHQPTFAQAGGASRAAGIYVFDANGNSQAFLASSPKKFTVAPDDGHLYGNMDDTSVRIFRILWTNR